AHSRLRPIAMDYGWLASGPSPAIPDFLLLPDWPARRAPDDRHHDHPRAGRNGGAAPLHTGLPSPRRHLGTPLAFRRHYLAFPVPAFVLDWPAHELAVKRPARMGMDETSPSAAPYYVVFAALVVLTLATVGLSFCPLGNWHTVIGLAIATVKAALVALF